MSTFTVVEKRLASKMSLLNTDWFQSDIGSKQKGVDLTGSTRSELPLYYHREFQEVGGTKRACLGFVDKLEEIVSFWFAVQHGH